MLSSELLRKIRRIELQTRKLVDTAFAGAYHSVFKGRGVEFHAVRPYQPGDDVRSIDWNVTARAGEPFVKQFVEERELTVMLLVDASASSFFGSRQAQKHDIGVEIGAVLAYAAIKNQDKVGLLVFSDHTELYLPPHKGRNHILRLIRELLAVQPSSKGTDIGLALRTVSRFLKRRTTIFLISDFLDLPEKYTMDLSLTAHNHDVIAVVLTDPLERQWKNIGLVALQDAETGVVQRIDTSQPDWLPLFMEQAHDRQETRKHAFNSAGVEQIEVQTDRDYLPAINAFFQRRILGSQR